MRTFENPTKDPAPQGADRVATPAATVHHLPTNKLAWALEMARRGLAVFPLQADTKLPLPGSRGHLDATTDPEVIRAWWQEPLSGTIRDHNIGASPRDGRHVVIDLDVRDDRNGIADYLALGGVVDGLVIETPSGGVHVYCAGDDLRTGAGRLAPGIDTRGADGYVVAPGSTIDGVPYKIVKDGPPIQVPAFIAEKIGTRSDRPSRIVFQSVESDQPQNIARAIQAARSAEPAMTGTWHDCGYRLGCELARIGLSPEKAVEVLAEHWVPRGQGFKSEAQFQRDVLGGYHDAVRDGGHGIAGVPSVEEVFGEVIGPPSPPESLSTIARNDDGPAWDFLNPAEIDDLDVPDPEFLVPGWLSPGHVTMLYADGGIGKSLIALQLMTALATGKPWLGLPVVPCRSIGLFCEDPQNELHRRQKAINRAMGVTRADIADMRYTTGVGQDNTLLTVDRDGNLAPTPAYGRLYSVARNFGARLIVIDTAADTFGGNENDRREVRGFIGAALGRLALDLDAAVLLIAQPSRDGIKTGRLDGASTAWNNTARARWTLDYVKGADGDTDPDERVLSKRKANYGRVGDEIQIRWTEGAFVQVAPLTVGELRDRWEVAERVFLDLLNRVNLQGRNVSPHRQAGTYAPKVFCARPDREGLLRSDFEGALDRLLNSGRVTIQTWGPPSKPSQRVVPTPSR